MGRPPMPTTWILTRMVGIVPWVLGAAAFGQAGPMVPTTLPAPSSAAIRAELRAERAIVQLGQPVWVHFSITNLTADPVTLRVPDAPATDEVSTMTGLPLAHVFSGIRSAGVHIKDARGEEGDTDFGWRPQGAVPVVRLAPYGSVGLRVELPQYFRSMLRPGQYTIIWRPYFGEVESAPVNVNIMAERQAVINTELGSMTVRFYYAEAPKNIENFIELVDKGFYDRLTFHRAFPQAFIQGGDPRGDGKGGRPDGKRVKAEFSQIPFERGTVGMARLPSDPDSASSQFFITTSRQPAFDGNQTAFGYLVGEESFQTLERIATAPTDEFGRLKKPVVIRTISLENVPGHEPSVFGSEGRIPPVTTRPAIISGQMDGPQGSSRLDLGGLSTQPAFGAGG